MVDLPSGPSAVGGVDAGPPLPPEVEDVLDVVKPTASCSVTDRAWRAGWGKAWALRVAPGGPVFARVSGARTPELTLDASGGVFFSVDVASARVGGFVEPRDALVTTHSVVVYDGFFAAFRSLLGASVVGVTGDHVTLRVAVPEGLELLGGAELRADVPCDGIVLDAENTDWSVSLRPMAALRRAILPAKSKIMLSVGPSDPPVARVSPDRAVLVSVLEQQAGRARIFWSAPTGSVFGWVASRELRPGPPPAGHLAEYDAFEAMRDADQPTDPPGFAQAAPPYRGGIAEPPAHAPREGEERVACLSPVRILAELGGRRYAVGQIPDGSPFVVQRRAGAVSPLGTPPSMNLGPGASLVVSSREIAGCTASRARASVVREGQVSAAGPGRLPLEIIQGIVRQNFGRFRLCYENGRKTDPELHGRVTTTFVIDPYGAVASTADGGSDLPDQDVVDCVVRGFGNLSFPAPEGGVVSVRYPVQFSLGD
jgi:hypothetical protein